MRAGLCGSANKNPAKTPAQTTENAREKAEVSVQIWIKSSGKRNDSQGIRSAAAAELKKRRRARDGCTKQDFLSLTGSNENIIPIAKQCVNLKHRNNIFAGLCALCQKPAPIGAEFRLICFRYDWQSIRRACYNKSVYETRHVRRAKDEADGN